MILMARKKIDYEKIQESDILVLKTGNSVRIKFLNEGFVDTTTITDKETNESKIYNTIAIYHMRGNKASELWFAIAGIWDVWESPDTEASIKTFSVITTRANRLLEKIHNTRKRMPVILQRANERLWLEGNLDKQVIQSMLSPYAVDDVEAYTVTKVISRLGLNTNNPEVIDEFYYPELPRLSK